VTEYTVRQKNGDAPVFPLPYGFLWGTAGSGFATTNNASDATYTGGTAISSCANNTPDLNNVLSRGVDRVFHVDIAAVPEPATSLLALRGGLMLLGRRLRQAQVDRCK